MSPLVHSDDENAKSNEVRSPINLDAYLLEDIKEDIEAKDNEIQDPQKRLPSKSKPNKSFSKKKKRYATKMSFIKEENDNDLTSKITNNDLDEFITSSDELSREATTRDNAFFTTKPTFNTKRFSLNEEIKNKPIKVRRTFLKENTLLSDLIFKQRQRRDVSLRIEEKFKNDKQDVSMFSTNDIKVSFDSIFKNCELSAIFNSKASEKSRLDRIRFCKIRSSTSKRDQLCFSAINKCKEHGNAVLNFDAKSKIISSLANKSIQPSEIVDKMSRQFKAVSLCKKNNSPSGSYNPIISQIDKVRAYLATPSAIKRD